MSIQEGNMGEEGESEKKRQLDLDIIEIEKQLTEYIWNRDY